MSDDAHSFHLVVYRIALKKALGDPYLGYFFYDELCHQCLDKVLPEFSVNIDVVRYSRGMGFFIGLCKVAKSSNFVTLPITPAHAAMRSVIATLKDEAARQMQN